MDHVPRKSITEIINKTIQFYENKMPDDENKNLYLARLYLYAYLTIKGIEYLISAANIIIKSKDKEKAFILKTAVAKEGKLSKMP
jgi:hypothetical protein